MIIWLYIVTLAWTVLIKNVMGPPFIKLSPKATGIAITALSLDRNKLVRLYALFAAKREALWGSLIFFIWPIDQIQISNLCVSPTSSKKKWNILISLMIKTRWLIIFKIYKFLNINNFTGGSIYHAQDGFYSI